jgi:AraC-like DNA-binding protein
LKEVADSDRIWIMRRSPLLVELLPEFPRLAAAANYRPRAFAKLCGVSLRSLERQCHECFGISPETLLGQAWLKKAEGLLADKLAKQINDELGCPSMSGLSHKFKNTAGITLKKWQSAHCAFHKIPP